MRLYEFQTNSFKILMLQLLFRISFRFVIFFNTILLYVLYTYYLLTITFAYLRFALFHVPFHGMGYNKRRQRIERNWANYSIPRKGITFSLTSAQHIPTMAHIVSPFIRFSSILWNGYWRVEKSWETRATWWFMKWLKT